MSCPVCGSERAGRPNLEFATPEPNQWCPELEDALEARDWRRWARQFTMRQSAITRPDIGRIDGVSSRIGDG